MRARLVTVSATAQQLGLSEITIRRMIQEGQLPSLLVRRRRLVPQEAIDELIRLGLEDTYNGLG